MDSKYVCLCTDKSKHRARRLLVQLIIDVHFRPRWIDTKLSFTLRHILLVSLWCFDGAYVCFPVFTRTAVLGVHQIGRYYVSDTLTYNEINLNIPKLQRSYSFICFLLIAWFFLLSALISGPSTPRFNRFSWQTTCAIM